MARIKKPISQAKIDAEFAKTAKVAKNQDHTQICLPILDNINDNILEVGYNGRMYLIKRGSKVLLPNAILDILDFANISYSTAKH